MYHVFTSLCSLWLQLRQLANLSAQKDRLEIHISYHIPGICVLFLEFYYGNVLRRIYSSPKYIHIQSTVLYAYAMDEKETYDIHIQHPYATPSTTQFGIPPP